MDASGPQTVYAGAGGLFKTSDGGATWQNIPAISGAVASVAADPNRSGVVYAAVFMNLGEWLDPEERRRGSYLGDYLSHDGCNSSTSRLIRGTQTCFMLRPSDTAPSRARMAAKAGPRCLP